jgi:hypothetical protein
MTEQQSCEHKWEDAQLRTTKDGMYILSVDYCARCGWHDLNYQLNTQARRIEALEAALLKYGWHDDCDAEPGGMIVPGPCSCGWEQARALLSPSSKEEQG